MATHGDIGLSQPAASTITLKLDAVTLDNNSTTVFREVMVLGSPETSNALTAVLNAAPASTAWALAVRVVDQPSTIVSISTGHVTVDTGSVRVVQSSAAELNVTAAQGGTWNVGTVTAVTTVGTLSTGHVTVDTGSIRVHQSTAGDLNVTVAGYSTIISVSTGSVRVHQSTAADLNVTVAGYSTIAAVSSLAGRVTTMPLSTVWASSAGFHFDSSGALQITGASASTQVAVSSVAGIVTVDGNSNSNSSVYLPVRLTNGTAFLTAAQDYQHGSTLTSTNSFAPAAMLRIGGPDPASTDTWMLQRGSTTGSAFVTLATDSGISVMDSTNRAINVNVVAGAAGGSTIITVSTGSVRVHQSTAGDLNVTVAGYSTIAAVSSVAGRVATMPFSTVWASSAGFHFDSSGALQITGASASTQVAVSTGNFTLTAVQHSSGGAVTVGDGDNNAIRVNVVAGAAAGSTIVTVSTGSVRVHQSTAADLNVTVAGYSTTVNISSLAGPVITRSSAANMLVSVYQSTAAELNVTVAGYSTTVAVSSIAGPVTVRSSAANFLASVYQSSAAELQVTASQNSTAWSVLSRVTTSSGGALEGSTLTPAASILGLHVRQVQSTIQSTTAIVTSSNSTAVYSLVSSVAAQYVKVHAYFVSASTSGNPSTFVFQSSNTIDRWHVGMSSGFFGANLAVSPPGFLFRTDLANALTCRIESASTAISARVSLSYVQEA